MMSFESSLVHIGRALAAGLEHERLNTRGAAVIVPIVPGEEGPELLFEVRASDLDIQPGEVCFPGGHIEPGETPREAAIRETCEELLVDATAVSIFGELEPMPGPRGLPLWVFIGTIRDYSGTVDPVEVDRTFTVPLIWFMGHEPFVYSGDMELDPPEDLPWDRISESYRHPWPMQPWVVPFYMETDPLIWGATARIIDRFVKLLESGGLCVDDLL